MSLYQWQEERIDIINILCYIYYRRDRYDECVDACVYGSIKQNRINVAFVKESVDKCWEVFYSIGVLNSEKVSRALMI